MKPEIRDKVALNFTVTGSNAFGLPLQKVVSDSAMKEGLGLPGEQMAVDQVESSRPKRRTARDLAGGILRWYAPIQYALITVRQYLFRSKDLASDVKPADGGVRQLTSVADANLLAKAPTNTASASDVPADRAVRQPT